jgi:N-acetylglucosamine-6-phosphate deacetylase
MEDGVITAAGTRGQVELPTSAVVVDLGDAVLAPGFVDIHVHGGGGHDVMEGDPDALTLIERQLAKHGTTTYFPTTVTAAVDPTLRALEKLADAIEAASTSGHARGMRAIPAGVHLEGPFISREKRGVHPPEHIKDADLALFDRMWHAARGHVKVMTVAPEITGGEELIREATKRGITISMGHSNATQEQARRGIAAGGRHATHTFNAMRPLDHREPGIIGAILTDERVTAEMIIDGVHVDPTVVRLFLKAKGPDGAVLVTDGISATGMPDGRYQLGGFEVEVKGDVCMSHDGHLAGSVLTLDRAVRNVMKFGGWKLDDAVRLASRNPARTVGVSERKGAIAPGADADFVVLTQAGEVIRTIVGGIG